jgi:hypothetical protein
VANREGKCLSSGDEDENNLVIWRQGLGCLNDRATNMHSLNTVLNRGAMKIMLYMTYGTLCCFVLRSSVPSQDLVLVALVHLAHVCTIAVERNATDTLLTRNIGSAVVDTDIDVAGVGGDWGLAGCFALGLAWGLRCGALAVC